MVKILIIIKPEEAYDVEENHFDICGYYYYYFFFFLSF